MVQKRWSDFEPIRHACPVHLHQKVVRQDYFHIGGKHSCELVRGMSRGMSLAKQLMGVVTVQTGRQVRRKQLATGFPRLVITIGSLVDLTCSIGVRHRALNCPAATFFMSTS